MLNNDYKEMLQCLDEAGVDYLLIGAYALAAHGYPRSTMDIDLWVKPSPENAKAVMAALKAFGAPLTAIGESDFTNDDLIFQIGVAPRRIDIITGVSGLSFSEAHKQSLIVDIEGLKVRIPTIEDLITNKRSTGRTKDLADAEALEELLDQDNQL